MIKAILFDLDGLIINKQEKMFSQRLAESVNLPWTNILEFFNGDFRECSFGRADLKEKMAPYLTKWNYKGTFEDLLKFWFESESNINEEVLKIIQDLHLKNVGCYISTRQEKYRKNYIWNELGLKNKFDGIFCTCDIGYDKSEKEYWDYVLKELNLKPKEIRFFCDSQKNVDKANSFGIESYYYNGIESLKDNI